MSATKFASPPSTRRDPRQMVIWSVVSIAGAIAWAVIAIQRGEKISAIWLIVAALASYSIAYRFYARFIVNRVLKVDDTRATAAERNNDGVDFHPTDRRVLLGHHFAAIAGAGPLVGPVLAAQMGYLPGTLWIIFGVILAGAVQDTTVMFFSMRRDGRSLGQMVRDEVGPVGGIAALVAVFSIMIILLAVLALVVVNALAHSPWGTFSLAMTIPIALFMGFYLRLIRPGRVIETSVIGVALLMLAIVSGHWVEQSSWADTFTLTAQQLVIALVVYGFFASVLPVWMLLAPRDYLSTFMKVGAIALLAVGVLVTAPILQNAAVTPFALNGTGPVFAGQLFPFVFITIACGALSGFHALVSSGTTPKMIQKESQIRLIGYGGMLMESSVAIMALIAASLLDPGLYYAMNAPAGLLGPTLESASAAVGHLGFTVTPAQLSAAAAAVQEKTLIARTGGAPTLAVGMSEILSQFLGGNGLKAFWYHFAIMFEALFILTTVDAGTRVGRFMLQDTLGNIYKPFARTNWKPGLWSTSAVVVLAWGYFLWVGVADPLGGINQLFPLFGIANQLLAAVALTLGTVILIKSGRVRYAWVTGLPLAWDVAVTLTASYQKVFSADPKIGFFANADRYSTAIDQGKILAPAKTMDQMHQVLTNQTVDGVLSAFFAALVIIILVNAIVVCVRALAAGGQSASAEAPYVESAIVAPTGLFATAAEKEAEAAAGQRERIGAP